MSNIHLERKSIEGSVCKLRLHMHVKIRYSLDVGLVVDDEERVDLGDDLVVDGDAVQVLLEERAQLRVLAQQRLSLLVQRQLV